MDKKNTENKKKEIDKLKEELEKTKKLVEEYKNKYLRALADYQNFEKRVDQEKEETRSIGRMQLLLKLLPVIDNLDKAEIFIKDKGLNQIKGIFFQLLKDEGLEELDVLGREFDPRTAEAIEMTKGEKDNIVIEVLRKGYRIGEKILRVAQVKVSKSQNANPKT